MLVAEVGLPLYYIQMERQKPAIGEIYHIYNRGVEKRKIFSENHDYLRFIHDLFEFNDVEPAGKIYAYKQRKQYAEVGLPHMKQQRKFIVEILSFCLMPNHFHLLLHQLSDNGITEFMRKLGTGYTNYFNIKYERVGSLFQGKYKASHIVDDKHLLYLPYYIHLNPLDMIMPTWRDDEITDKNKAISFLETYRWSSYLDYIGKKNFPSVTQRDFIYNLYSDNMRKSDFRMLMIDWLKERGIEDIEHLVLE